MSKKQPKIIQIYKNKYDMNLGSLSMFLNQKIEASSYQIDVIQKKIKDLQIPDSFNDYKLSTILRLIAAVQIGKDVTQINQQQIRAQQNSITFKTGKSKNKKDKKNSHNEHKEQSMPIQVQQNQNQKQNEKYPSITYQINEATQKIKQYQKQAKQSDIKIKQSLNKYQEIQVDIQEQQPVYIKKEQSKKQIKITQQIKPQRKIDEVKIQIRQQIKNKQEKTNKSDKINKQKQIQKVQQMPKKAQQKKRPSQIQSSPKKVSQSKLKTIFEQSSTQIHLNSEKDEPVFLQMGAQKAIKKVKISGYQKYSIDYVNSVIKFKVQYKGNYVQRRYSDFQKLMVALCRKYQGIILPELPPKQGIKGGISYFWGIDQTFLNQRQTKLQDLLNRLLQSKFIQKDELLEQFLAEQTFQIDSNQQGFGSYLKTVTDIVFNAKQLKDYGMAYYTYLKQSGAVKLNNDLQKMYESIQQTINIFADLNSYRMIININFEKRRKIMFDQSIKCKSATNQEFDKIMELAIDQIKNLHNEYNKYRGLKNQQSWICSLIKQKSDEATTKAYVDLKKQQTSLKERIQKMQRNLMKSLLDFSEVKKGQLQKLGEKLLHWRKIVHP